MFHLDKMIELPDGSSINSDIWNSMSKEQQDETLNFQTPTMCSGVIYKIYSDKFDLEFFNYTIGKRTPSSILQSFNQNYQKGKIRRNDLSKGYFYQEARKNNIIDFKIKFMEKITVKGDNDFLNFFLKHRVNLLKNKMYSKIENIEFDYFGSKYYNETSSFILYWTPILNKMIDIICEKEIDMEKQLFFIWSNEEKDLQKFFGLREDIPIEQLYKIIKIIFDWDFLQKSNKIFYIKPKFEIEFLS